MWGWTLSDRYFAAAPEVRAALERRVAENAEHLAKHGAPRKGFYLTGRVGDRAISLHAEGEKVVLVEEGQGREEEEGTELPGRHARPSSYWVSRPGASRATSAAASSRRCRS